MGGAKLSDFSFTQSGGESSKQQCFHRLRGGVNHGCACVREKMWKFLAQFFPQFVIEIHEGLVEQNQFRLLHKSASQCCALLLSSGQFRRSALQEESRQFQQFRYLPHLHFDFGFRQPLHPQRRCNVVENRHVWKVYELLVNHGYVAFLDR